MIENNFNKDLERKIDLYANGKLNEQEIDALWEELIQSEYYLDYTKSVVNIKSLLDEKKKSKVKIKTFSLQKVASYTAAAAAVIIIATFGVINYTATNQSALDLSPIASIDYGTVRSVEVSEDVVSRAMELASNGRIEEAISLLSNELKNTTSSVKLSEISLSLGSIQYNYGDYESAIISFKNVVEQEEATSTTKEKAYWFLGNAYFQLDRLDEAKIAFQNAYQIDGSLSRVVKTYLDAIGR